MKHWIFIASHLFVTVAVGDPVVFISSPGQFASPNFPRRYPARVNSTWYIIASPGYRIDIVFNNVDIEFSRGCEHDSLAITELTESTNTVLGRLCGRFQNPTRYLTKGHYLIVNFVTDNTVQRSGFSANFSFIGKVDKTESPTTEMNPTTSLKMENKTLTDTMTSSKMTSTLSKSTFQDGADKDNENKETFATFVSNELFYPNANVVFPLLILNILLLIALVLLAIYTCRLRRLRLRLSKSNDALFLVNPNYDDQSSSDDNFRRLGTSQQSLNDNNEEMNTLRTQKGRRNIRGHGQEDNSKARSEGGSKNADMMYSVIEDILPSTSTTDRNRKSLHVSAVASIAGNTRVASKSPTYSLARAPGFEKEYIEDRRDDPENDNLEKYSQIDLEEDLYDHTESSNRISQDIYAKVEHDKHNCKSHHQCDVRHSFMP